MVDETQEDEIITEEDLAPEVVEPSKEEIAAQEAKAKEAADIAKAKEIEEARVAEEARQQDLKDRYAGLADHRMAAAQLNISNPDLHFNTFIMAEKNHTMAESLMLELEAMDKKCQAELQATAHLEKRRVEYAQIDILLLEGLAEREAGDETKIKLYNEKRAAIRLKHPKV